MAREHARIWLDINDDEDFEKLSPLAQWLYVRVLLTEATLNYCGVADWRPKRLLRKAAGLTLDALIGAAGELEEMRYALFDLDTEEVLVRSYVRRDELLRNPKMAATVIKAYPAVASPVLRAAVVTELVRIRSEHPEYSSWEHKDTAAGLTRILGKSPLSEVGYTYQISNPHPVRNGDPSPVTNSDPGTVKNTDPDPGPDHQSQSARNPSTSTSTLHPSPFTMGGSVSGVPHQGPVPGPSDLPPSEFCSNHPTGTQQACRACGAAADRRKAWDAEQRAVRAAVLADCPDCDEYGWMLDENGQTTPESVKCTHGAAVVSHA
ncbi:hypothetical protein [Mycolicibacterium fluoranthenivorans]|uniref:Helix-turn-helix DNA binding domain protein n=1 Tax=Mycolicibacterium fluoranthenivorans TaxID=258505 RepID=A0A1G4X2Q8_9MYCO|nr:hypothetical protein [Mycolicibacterium fluoranthenivorans]SCX34518.1 hypothetical protein SAMN02799620_06363 [Mycolicibacterium fluoranthenivorans]